MKKNRGVLMKTSSELCKGCNKCIFVCPTHANNAILEGGENKIHVNDSRCIYCGECLDICDHCARVFTDSTEEFFADLAAGKKISVIAAPAIQHNIPEYEKLFTYLRKLGVNVIYDVSFGADITTWGYLRAAKEMNIKSMISQPCPVVVGYIENFKPELIDALAPVHSPAVCTAIYMKKYMSMSDDIAFLSPCISKSIEFSDPNTGGFVKYNVTYKNLIKYMNDHQIDLNNYENSPFDNMQGNLGFVFSRPGGLKENVRFYANEDVWVHQIEGIKEIKSYLNDYAKRMADNEPIPFLVDALNCKEGCNLGTATDKNLSVDTVNYATNKKKKEVDRQKAEQLMTYFDDTLKLNDFIRNYSDRSNTVEQAKKEDIDRVFDQLGKHTDEDRKLNCFSCGYGSCYDFACAVALGQNHKENCFQYSRKLIADQGKELETQHNIILESIQYASKIQRNLLPRLARFEEAFTDHSIIWNPRDVVGGDVYWLKVFEKGSVLCVCDCTGHGTPGALLTMLVCSAFESIVNENNCDDPALIMVELDQRLATSLNAENALGDTTRRSIIDFNDGCDLAILFIPADNSDIQFASGNTKVFVCNGTEVKKYTGQRLHIGSGYIKDKSDVTITIIPGDANNKYYVASDGLFDQIGEDGKKFGYKRLENLIMDNHHKSQAEISAAIWKSFELKRGTEQRRDDVELITFKV